VIVLGGNPDGSRRYIAHTLDPVEPSLRRRISHGFSDCLEKFGSIYEIITSRLDSKKLGHLPKEEYTETGQ
jgi:hypothetical protein